MLELGPGVESAEGGVAQLEGAPEYAPRGAPGRPCGIDRTAPLEIGVLDAAGGKLRGGGRAERGERAGTQQLRDEGRVRLLERDVCGDPGLAAGAIRRERPAHREGEVRAGDRELIGAQLDRKSTRLNSSHLGISY